MRVQRKTAKAVDVAVSVAIGGTALVVRFATVKEGELTIAVTVPGARKLAALLAAQADVAAALASQSGPSRH